MDFTNIFANMGKDRNTVAGEVQQALIKKLAKRLAYRFGSAAKEGSGLTARGFIDAFKEKREYDELGAYLYGPESVGMEPFYGKTNGPSHESMIGTRDAREYRGLLNPDGEYVFPASVQPVLEQAANVGSNIYINADHMPYTGGYRYDAANHPVRITRDGTGALVGSAADLYDFDPGYLKRYDAPAWQVISMAAAGTPYIVRQDNIPIRFVGDNASEDDKMKASMTMEAWGSGETPHRKKKRTDLPAQAGGDYRDSESIAIENTLLRSGMPILEPSVVIADYPQRTQYHYGGLLRRFDDGGDTGDGSWGWIEKLTRGAKNAARRAISKEARLAESYSSKKYTFDAAYKDARRKGQKTFFWNGDYYNTDYEGAHGRQYKRDVASGKAAAFQAAYPGYTNPELRKEKQEELDTYGITNEQTTNKTQREKKLRKIDPKSYNIQTAINSLVSGFDYSKNGSTKEAEDLFVKKYGRIAKDYLDAWEQFDRRFEEEDKFLEEMKKKYPIAEKNGASVQFFMSDEDFKEMRNRLDPFFVPPYEREEFRDIASKYDRFVGPVTENNVFRGGTGKHRDEYDYLLGYPQTGNTIGISKYRTGTLPYYYDVGIRGSFNNELEPGNHIVGDNGNYGMHQLDGVSPVLKTLLRPLIKEEKPNVEFGDKHGVKFNVPLGMFTLSKPKSNEYMSVWDIFDIDPFGYGNDKSLIKVGRPFEYYSRIYPDGNEPDIDYLYDSFEFANGGLIRGFDDGGSIHIKPEIFSGKVYYRNGGILEGDFEVDDISDEELRELAILGYNVEIL